MPRPNLKDVTALSPAQIAMQREREAGEAMLAECGAVHAETAALTARCEDLLRLRSVPPGYAAAVRDLLHGLKRIEPTMRGILTTQDRPV